MREGAFKNAHHKSVYGNNAPYLEFCLSEKVAEPRQAILQEIHVLYIRRMYADEPRQISTIYTEDGQTSADISQLYRACRIAPLCKATRPAGSRIQSGEEVTQRKQDKLSSPKHTPGHLRLVASHRRITLKNAPKRNRSLIDRAPLHSHRPTRTIFDLLVIVELIVHFSHAAACGISGTFRNGPAFLTS